MSAEDVKHKSKSVTETRDIHFPLTVPAGERRTVDEKTTVTSVATIYEAAIRAQGSVGIEVNPGWWTPNIYIWYYNIEYLFPNAEAASRISRSSTNTAIDTKVLKMPKHLGGDEKVAGILVEYHSFNSDIEAVGAVGFDGFDSEGPGIAVSSTQAVKSSPPGPSPFVASMKIRVQFAGMNPEVPLEKRLDGMERLRALIAMNVHHIGNPTAISYAYNFAFASFSIPYDPQQIEELGVAVINEAHGIHWGGKYAIYFS